MKTIFVVFMIVGMASVKNATPEILELTHSAPRSVRMGESFELSVKLTNISNKRVKVAFTPEAAGIRIRDSTGKLVTADLIGVPDPSAEAFKKRSLRPSQSIEIELRLVWLDWKGATLLVDHVYGYEVGLEVYEIWVSTPQFRDRREIASKPSRIWFR